MATETELTDLHAAHVALLEADPAQRAQRMTEWRAAYEQAWHPADEWETTTVVLNGTVHAHLTAGNFDPGLTYVLCGVDINTGSFRETDDPFPRSDPNACTACAEFNTDPPT